MADPKPVLSPPSFQQQVDNQAADVAADAARRQKWIDDFAKQPITFDADLLRCSVPFIGWFNNQASDVQDALRTVWTDEAVPNKDISHAHERGRYARMKIVVGLATDKYGYSA